MTIVLTPVDGRRALGEFCELPLRLHPADRYVPVLKGQIRDWYRSGATELHLARNSRTGRALGRVCLHRSPAMDARLGRATQLFGLLEFSDAEVAGVLFDLVRRTGARAGAKGEFGPVNLLPNQSGGVITSGFAERGFIDSAWNPSHYPAIYEHHGFLRRFVSDTWICENVHTTDADFAFPFDDARIASERLRVHHGSRRRLKEQLPLLRTMLNASFAQLPYYTEISAEQLAARTDGLAHLLDERLLLYLTKDGEPIAFVLAVPDISEFVAGTGGRLTPARRLHLLATRSRYRRDAVLVIKGTVPGHQGQGYLTLLSRELHRGLREGGYRTLRGTFVEHGNEASAAQYRRAGGRPLHGYTFYERDL